MKKIVETLLVVMLGTSSGHWALAANNDSGPLDQPLSQGQSADKPTSMPQANAAAGKADNASRLVLESLKRRKEAPRKTEPPADVARLGQMGNALAQAVRSAGVNLDEYLAASKKYVEMPAGQGSSAYMETVNAKFAAPIRAAIAKAVGIPVAGDLLQRVQTGVSVGLPVMTKGGPPPSSCCNTQRFSPPFQGISREGNLGARSVAPGPFYGLEPQVRGFGVWAPHDLEGSGLHVTVPDTARYVSVTVDLDTSWVIGLSGLGYAHVWFGLDMDVSIAGGGIACSAPHIEQDNQWTWAGGILKLTDHHPAQRITRTCEFERSPGDGTDYVVNVSASADATFVGTSAGSGNYSIKFGPVDVTSCP
jgi:hypothetical protein